MIEGNDTWVTQLFSVEHATLKGEPVGEDETGRIDQ